MPPKKGVTRGKVTYMTLFHVLARRLALAATVACVFVSAACPAFAAAHKSKPAAQPAGPGAQQPAPGNAQEQQKAQLAEVARKSYDAGLKEFAAGRTQSAIEQLTTAVKSGVLKPSEMAKALLTRGLAYKKENKPGQAISHERYLAEKRTEPRRTEIGDCRALAGLSDGRPSGHGQHAGPARDRNSGDTLIDRACRRKQCRGQSRARSKRRLGRVVGSRNR